MKYRAVAVGLGKDGHPVSILGNGLKAIEDWADAIFASSKCAEVQIFINEERLLETKKRPSEELA